MTKRKNSDQIDRIDNRMIGILMENGRISVIELAERVGISKTPCPVAAEMADG